MKKKTLCLATFVLIGAGSAGAQALNNVKMYGACNYRSFDIDIITAAACPDAVGITYVNAGHRRWQRALHQRLE